MIGNENEEVGNAESTVGKRGGNGFKKGEADERQPKCLFSPTRPVAAPEKGRVYLLCSGRPDAALHLVSGVRLEAARLEYELVRRGWDAADLARAAGVSQGTLSSARQGKRINQRTLIRLVVALSRQPVVPEVDLLLEVKSA